MGILDTINPLMVSLLKSPLHGLISKQVMLLTYTGRKSGKTYTTPVDYHVDGDSLFVLSSPKRTWWKNLRGGAPVRLLVERKEMTGVAEALEDEASVEKGLLKVAQASAIYRRSFKVDLDANGQPKDPEVLKAVAGRRVIIRIRNLQAA